MKSPIVIGALGIAIALSACVALAPGADKIRVTKNAADVASCSAVGNINVPRDAQGQIDTANAGTQFRNQTVGLGGNTAFVTSSPWGVPAEGIAYRCP
jgi:hypothetical protein